MPILASCSFSKWLEKVWLGKVERLPRTLERPVLCITEWGQGTGVLFTVVDGDLNVQRVILGVHFKTNSKSSFSETLWNYIVQDSRYFLTVHISTAGGEVDSFCVPSEKNQIYFSKLRISPHSPWQPYCYLNTHTHL